MSPATLATALRARQYGFDTVPRALIDALTDDEIIAAYITCSCCGEKAVTPWQLRKAIDKAHDADSFFDAVDALSRRHPSTPPHC